MWFTIYKEQENYASPGMVFFLNTLNKTLSMKQHTFLAFSATILMACGQSNQPKSQEEASQDSTAAMASSMDYIDNSSVNFVTSVANANLKEIELGKVALQHADYLRIRNYAQKMIDTHTKANRELQQAGYSTGITLPTALDRSDMDDVKKLAEKDGKAFDRAYIKAMVQLHQRNMERLDAAVSDMKDTALLRYAKNTLPVVEAHLKEARDIQEDVRKMYDPLQGDDISDSH